jgi:NAD(P)-dependent dehydrogenase (short-subunit alcohol dehydrogenase family)
VRALDATAQRHGRLDVLVNNAMYTGMGLLADQPLADWQQNFRINADAVFVSMQAAFRLMPKNGGGSIVTSRRSAVSARLRTRRRTRRRRPR